MTVEYDLKNVGKEPSNDKTSYIKYYSYNSNYYNAEEAYNQYCQFDQN